MALFIGNTYASLSSCELSCLFFLTIHSCFIDTAKSCINPGMMLTDACVHVDVAKTFLSI